jgi:glycosyltransferase involved in cell wall biosynthesis
VKVLLVDPSLYTPPYDGALARALQDRGHEVTLVGRAPRATDPPLGPGVRLEPLFYRAGERVPRIPALRQVAKGVEHAADLARLRRYVRAVKPDVVHWQWPSLPFLDAHALRAMRAVAPQVVTVHDGRVFKAKAGLRRVMGFGWGDFVGAADAVVAHVGTTRDALGRLGVDADRIRIVPHPVFARPAGTRRPVTGAHPLRAIYFGRISDDKGIDVLAAALERLASAASAPPLHVTVCGPLIREDRRAAEAVERLCRLPFVTVDTRFVPEDDLDHRIEASDLVILPHREVDASGVLMKALGYDVGVVASDVRAFREVLDGTSAARLFRADDPAHLANVLSTLAADRDAVERMRAATVQLRTWALSWPRAAELTEAVYDRVLRARAGAPALETA